MITIRRFKNQFAEDLYCCIENDTDGIYSFFLRFRTYLDSVDAYIEESNKGILREIENEDNKIRSLILSQPEVDNSLNYFKNILFKSILVSIYSFFESKLAQISEICENHLSVERNLKFYKKSQLSEIQKYNMFLEKEIINELNGELGNFKQLLFWKDIRNYIVHVKSIDRIPNKHFLNKNGLKAKYGELVFEDKQGFISFSNLCENYLERIVELINNKYGLVERSQPIKQ